MLRLKDPKVYDEWQKNRVAALRQGPQAHREYLDANQLKQYLSAKEVKEALDKESPGFYEDYMGALKGLREYDEMQGKQRASLVGGIEGEKPFEELNYGWRFATQPVNIGMSFRETPEEDFSYTYDRKTGQYKKIYEKKRDGGKMMSYYQSGLDFQPKTISKNGVEIAQNGNGVPKYYLRKQAFRESEYDPNAISPMGAIGLTQIMPNTYKDYLKATGDKPGDLTDPKESVKVQKWIMDGLYNAGFINKPNQSEEVRMAKVFASYNAGRGKVSKLLDEAKRKGIDIYNTLDWTNELPKETRTYINQILLNKDPDFEERYQKALKTSPYAKLYEEAEEAPKKFKSNVPTIFDLGVKPKSQKKGGKVKKDNDGYWNPENWGKPVEIDSNEITMEGVYEPLLGISDTGDVQMMYPGEDYTFDGDSVTEYPVAQKGIKTLPTVTVNSLSNPKLKAYKDSLNLYNKGLMEQKEFMRVVNSLGIEPTTFQSYVPERSGRIQPSKNTMILPSSFTSSNTATFRTKDGKIIELDERSSEYKTLRKGFDTYVKPKTPVVYKKPTPPAPPPPPSPAKQKEQPKPAPVEEPKYQMKGDASVFGPAGSFIGTIDAKSRIFYPDFDNTAARAKVNQNDSKLINDKEQLLDFLKRKDLSVDSIAPKKKSGGWLDKYK
jgi:hypothetical protein